MIYRANNMKLQSFFWAIFILLVVGTCLSFASLLLPVYVDRNLLSSAGDIAAGVAAAFGIAIACLALFVFLYRDSTEQKIADQTYAAKERLEEALLHGAELIKVAAENNGGAISGVDDRMIHQAFIMMREALEEARKVPLYSALMSVSKNDAEAAGNFLGVLEGHLRADLSEKTAAVSHSVFISIPILLKALKKLNADNIKTHACAESNDKEVLGFFEKISSHIISEQRRR